MLSVINFHVAPALDETKTPSQSVSKTKTSTSLMAPTLGSLKSFLPFLILEPVLVQVLPASLDV
ncbi:MAG: hypothetical protein ACK5X6_06335 [Chryseotalea sp.]